MQIPFFKQLEPSRNILIAGAGGGFDIFSGLPLHAWLTAAGKTVFLANYSFSDLDSSGCDSIDGNARIINGKASPMGYFPEKLLWDWFAGQGREVPIIAFPKTGVVPLLASYRTLVDRHEIDTVILIDGGTDSLMKGDEPGLGTIVEDATSMVAVNELGLPRSFLACLGFGIDHFHGVSHHSFLENTAEMVRLRAYLGALALTPEMPEAQAFLSAVAYANAQQPLFRSIVCNSIADAIAGQFGDVQSSGRTDNSQLFVNPLMAMYWFYDLASCTAAMGFYDDIRHSRSEDEVILGIDRHRRTRVPRPRLRIPL